MTTRKTEILVVVIGVSVILGGVLYIMLLQPSTSHGVSELFELKRIEGIGDVVETLNSLYVTQILLDPETGETIAVSSYNFTVTYENETVVEVFVEASSTAPNMTSSATALLNKSDWSIIDVKDCDERMTTRLIGGAYYPFIIADQLVSLMENGNVSYSCRYVGYRNVGDVSLKAWNITIWISGSEYSQPTIKAVIVDLKGYAAIVEMIMINPAEAILHCKVEKIVPKT